MAGGPDIIGRDGPQRAVPSWLPPLAVVLAVCAGAGWFVVSRDDERAAPAPATTSPIRPFGGEPSRDCADANLDGVAWGPPSGAVQPDGRLVSWRVQVCNRTDRAVTVESLRPLNRAERALPAEQVRALRRDGVATDAGGTQALPVRIPAGGVAAVGTVSVVLGCDPSGGDSGLSLTVRLDGRSRRLDLPLRMPGVSPVQSWCNDHRGGGQSAVPLLRDGAVTVVARDRSIDLRAPLFNPNALPITLTGLHSPSPGVTVTGASVVTLQPGGRASVSVRLFVGACSRVFVDAPWQLTFIGRSGGDAVRLGPVRLGVAGWQAEALRQICPASRPLPVSTSGPELKVTGPVFRADRASLQVTQIVRNVSGRELVVRAHPRSAPGMEYVRAAVLPEAAAHAAIGTTTGGRLREWSMPPGASAFLTYFYRLGADTEAQCLAPPTDRWRAPVDATDRAGRPVDVGDDVTETAPRRRVWVGGWLVDATASCARPVPPQRAAPFLILAGRPELTPGDKELKYPLTLYPVPGEALAAITGVRLVGAYADLPISSTSGPGEVSASRRSGPSIILPIRCPEPGVPIILAVSYRTGSAAARLPVLVDLSAVPVNTTRGC